MNTPNYRILESGEILQEGDEWLEDDENETWGPTSFPGHRAASNHYRRPIPQSSVHNPDNLTDEQVGVSEGWRLLDEDEIIKSGQRVECSPMEAWVKAEGGWDEGGCPGNTWRGNTPTVTYRTKLTRDELLKARGLSEQTRTEVKSCPDQRPSQASETGLPQSGNAASTSDPETRQAVFCARCGVEIGKSAPDGSLQFCSGSCFDRHLPLHPTGEQALASALAETQALTAQLDLNRDEFQTILALCGNHPGDQFFSEIAGLCDRSQKRIIQTVPVIKQRDDLERRCGDLKAENANLHKLIDELNQAAIDAEFGE